jgi:hypothetical protein
VTVETDPLPLPTFDDHIAAKLIDVRVPSATIKHDVFRCVCEKLSRRVSLQFDADLQTFAQVFLDRSKVRHLLPFLCMPWRCPACRTHVQHGATLPRADCVYRCPVCRLQMTFDPTHQKMKPVPPNDDDDNREKRRSAA